MINYNYIYVINLWYVYVINNLTLVLLTVVKFVKYFCFIFFYDYFKDVLKFLATLQHEMSKEQERFDQLDQDLRTQKTQAEKLKTTQAMDRSQTMLTHMMQKASVCFNRVRSSQRIFFQLAKIFEVIGCKLLCLLLNPKP